MYIFALYVQGISGKDLKKLIFAASRKMNWTDE